MKKLLKRTAIVAAVLIALIVLAGIVLYAVGTSRLNQTFDIEPETIAIPSDSASLARGAYWANALCSECHGEDLSGKLMFAEPGIAAVYAPNITPSDEGVGAFSDADYVRAVRHSVNPDGRPYMIMPSEVFINWSVEDLASTIAYVKSLPPSNNVTPPAELGPMGRILLAVGLFGDIFPAEYIDHDAPFPKRPEMGPTAEYGRYFVRAGACTMCHRDDMRGGPPPQGIPEMGQVPPAVTGGGWSKEQFLTAVTTGIKPNGDTLNADWMSWDIFAKYSEVELEAVHAFLKEQLAADPS